MESPVCATSTPREAPSHVNKPHVLPDTTELPESNDSDFFQDQQHPSNVLQALKVQKNLGILCDITILAGDCTLAAHKCVLAANSSYFNSMLANSHNSPSTVHFSVEDPAAFSDILDFMYTGKLTLHLGRIREYLRINQELNVPNVKQSCVQYLQKVISMENWSFVLEIAMQYTFTKLKEHIETFLVSKFSELHTDEVFLRLPLENFAGIIPQVNQGQIWTVEYLIFESILRYSHGNNLENDALESLLAMLNLSVMSSDNVTSVLEKLDIDGVDSAVLEKFKFRVQKMGLSKQASLEDGMLMRRAPQRQKVQAPPVSEATEHSVKRKRGRPRKIVEQESLPEDDASETYEDDYDTLHEEQDEDEGEETTPKRGKRGPYKKKTDVFQCSKCAKLFKSQSILQRHFKGHGNDDPLTCEICGFSTLHQSSLYTHLQTHNGAKFKCTYEGCVYSCTRRQQLDDHVNNRHLGLLQHICSVCGKSFSGRKHLQRHERIHSGNILTCDLCEWSSSRRDKLRDHIRRHHPEWALQSGFASEDEVNKFKLTRGPRPKGETPPVKEKAPKRERVFPKGHMHKCGMTGCNFETRSNSRIRDHANSHLGIKNYICATCGKAFTLQRDLKRHELVHLEVKPFNCTQCQWATTRSDKLREHICKQHAAWALETGFATHDQIEKAAIPPPRRIRKKSGVANVAETVMQQLGGTDPSSLSSGNNTFWNGVEVLFK